MRPLRVLHVIPSLSPRDGGPTQAIGIIERALSQAGVQVTTLTTDHELDLQGRPCPPLAANSSCRIYAHKWTDTYKIAPGLVPHLVQAVRGHDVVHIHALFSFASTAAAWVAHRRGVPYVVRPLGTLGSYGMRGRRHRLKRLSTALIEGRILRRAAAVHFTSRTELEEAEGLGLAMRSVVIPLGMDRENAGPGVPIEHEALVGRRVILFLSRLDPKKNLEALIDAVASSQMLESTCALLIAGTGEASYVSSLKARAAAAGLADRTVWLGHVEGAQKRSAFSTADVFVLPSFSENFGIAAVEALLSGLPCILGKGVAVATEVEKEGGGLAIAPEPVPMARALERVLDDEGLRRKMGARAAEFANHEYSTRTMTRRLLALYEEILDNSKISPRL